MDPVLELCPPHELIAKDGVIWKVERSQCQPDEVEKIAQQPEFAVWPDHERLQFVHDVLDSQILERLLHSSAFQHSRSHPQADDIRSSSSPRAKRLHDHTQAGL